MQLNWIPCHRIRLALNYMIGFDICLSWSKNDLTYMIHQCLCTLWRMACCQEFWIINSSLSPSLSVVDPKQAFDKRTTPSVSLACRCSNITRILLPINQTQQFGPFQGLKSLPKTLIPLFNAT